MGKIQELLADVAIPKFVQGVTCEFAWTGIQEVKEVNKTLYCMTDDQRINFIRTFLTHWMGATYRNTDQGPLSLIELRTIFGPDQDHRLGGRLLYTLTHSEQEFRIWDGLPSTLSYDHAESNGLGLLVSVRGPKALVTPYHQKLMDPQAQVLRVPNGTLIWGFGWGWKE